MNTKTQDSTAFELPGADLWLTPKGTLQGYGDTPGEGPWYSAETVRELLAQYGTPLAQADAEPLWCVHIPGPDDVHAAPSNEEAVKAAASHNAHMRAYWEKRTAGLTPEQIDNYPALQSCLAHVVPWPHDAQSHAESVKDWKLEDWLPKAPAAALQPAASGEQLHELSMAELLQRAERDSDAVSCFTDGTDWSDAGAMALIVKPGQAKAVHDLLAAHGFITPGKPVADALQPAAESDHG